MIDSTETVLKFIQTSDFKKAPNPAKYIMRGYVAKTKSSIQWDEFLRIIKALEKDGYLEKSTGPHGEDCYFLLDKQNKKVWYRSIEIWLKIVGLLTALLGILKLLLG